MPVSGEMLAPYRMVFAVGSSLGLGAFRVYRPTVFVNAVWGYQPSETPLVSSDGPVREKLLPGPRLRIDAGRTPALDRRQKPALSELSFERERLVQAAFVGRTGARKVRAARVPRASRKSGRFVPAHGTPPKGEAP